MQRRWHKFASIHPRHWMHWRLAGIAFFIAPHVLLMFGFAVVTAAIPAAQPSVQSAPGPVFLPATPIRKANRLPPYPKDSMLEGEEGSVLVRLTIAADGQVDYVQLVKSSGSAALDRTTVRWIKARWRFHPATRNGQPVVSTITIEVTFALRR
ncbi:energy transducer TonB [Massilia cavernae]